jgi:hypothetical protein
MKKNSGRFDFILDAISADHRYQRLNKSGNSAAYRPGEAVGLFAGVDVTCHFQ